MTDYSPELVIVPPEFSSDGNTGIEQCGAFLGVYTLCCDANPEPVTTANAGWWRCERCNERLAAYAPAETTTIDVRSSSETRVQEWIAVWLNKNFHLIGVTISLP